MLEVERELLLVRGSGWIAAILLILAIAPLGRWRRTFGLWSLAVALLHLASGLATPLVPDVLLLLYEPHLRSGATALLVLLLLGVTSFPSVVQRAGIRQWKALHRAVHPAALLVLHHALLSPHLPRAGFWALAIAIGLLAGARLVQSVSVVRRTSG